MTYLELHRDSTDNALDILEDFVENGLRRHTYEERREIVREIGRLCAPQPQRPDPYKLVEEYNRLKEIMPYYPSDGELMRLALQSMEHAVT